MAEFDSNTLPESPEFNDILNGLPTSLGGAPQNNPTPTQVPQAPRSQPAPPQGAGNSDTTPTVEEDDSGPQEETTPTPPPTPAPTFVKQTPVPASVTEEGPLAGVDAETLAQILQIANKINTPQQQAETNQATHQAQEQVTDAPTAPAHVTTGTRTTAATPTVRQNTPTEGWQRYLGKYFKWVKKSPTEQQHDKWTAQVRRPKEGCRIIGVAGFKGGVGKTNTAMGVAATLKSVLGGNARIAAVDLDPTGTLHRRSENGEHTSDVQALAERIPRGINNVRTFASSAFDEVDVYASRRDIATPELGAEQTTTILHKLRESYDYIICDMSSHWEAEAYKPVYAMMDSLLFVVTPKRETLDRLRDVPAMLANRGVPDLLDRTIMVINAESTESEALAARTADTAIAELDTIFGGAGREHAVRLPFDDALVDVYTFALHAVAPGTKWALLETTAKALTVMTPDAACATQ